MFEVFSLSEHLYSYSAFCFCKQRLGTFGPLRCGEMYALDRLLREARVLELIRWVVKDSRGGVIQPEEGESRRFLYQTVILLRVFSLWCFICISTVYSYFCANVHTLFLMHHRSYIIQQNAISHICH